MTIKEVYEICRKYSSTFEMEDFPFDGGIDIVHELFVDGRDVFIGSNNFKNTIIFYSDIVFGKEHLHTAEQGCSQFKLSTVTEETIKNQIKLLQTNLTKAMFSYKKLQLKKKLKSINNDFKGVA